MATRNTIVAVLTLMCLTFTSVTACERNVHITMPDSRTVQAESRDNKARVYYSQPSAYADNYYGSISIDRRSGPSSGDWFYEGDNWVNFRFSAMDKSGEQSFRITVQVPRCSSSEVNAPFPHGQRQCESNCGERNVNGVFCHHTCDAGFDLIGSSGVTCQYTHWSGNFPYCKANTCFDPSQNVGSGLWHCDHGFGIYAQCQLVCNTGYSSRGSTQITCLDTGKWQQVSASCIDTQKPDFPTGCVHDLNVFSEPKGQPVKVSWTDPAVRDNSGGAIAVTYSSNPGSSFSLGNHTVNVTATDAAGNSARCDFEITVQSRFCPPLPTVDHASGVTCTYGRMEGSACTYACQNGYEIHGQDSMTCLHSEVWNNVPPQCLRVSCGQPLVQHGHFDCANGTSYTDECQLACDSGYVVTKHDDVTCMANRHWTESGFCLDVEPPTFVSGCDDMEVFAARLGETTVVQWPDPDVTDNSQDPVTLRSDVSRVMFQPGVTRITIAATDPTGNNNTCSFTVNVTTLHCGQPNLEPHQNEQGMVYHPSRHGDVYGTTWSVSCLQNYTKLGSDVIACDVDNSTYPPVPRWTWPGEQESMKPTCAKISCPTLKPPANGALSCFPGDNGVDCAMSCDASYEIPRLYQSARGMFSCSSQRKIWVPSIVPDCIVAVAPHHVRLSTDIYFYTDTCQHSLEELKHEFIRRVTSSQITRDACVGVPLCVWENVQVSCGLEVNPGNRRKRSLGKTFVSFSVDLKMTGKKDNATSLQDYRSIQERAVKRLGEMVRSGDLSFGGLTPSNSSVFGGTLHCDCPPGTACTVSQHSDRISCVGCGRGHYMPAGDTECHECPVGSYQSKDTAEACTPCPPNTSTITTATANLTQCL